MQSIAHPVCVIWKITLGFVKKHVSYTWIISSAMLGGQKRGVRPNPLEPPLCTGLIKIEVFRVESGGNGCNVTLEADIIFRCTNCSVESNIICEEIYIALWQDLVHNIIYIDYKKEGAEH